MQFIFTVYGESWLIIKAAEQQLEIATLLGYTDKDSKAYEDSKTR